MKAAANKAKKIAVENFTSHNQRALVHCVLDPTIPYNRDKNPCGSHVLIRSALVLKPKMTASYVAPKCCMAKSIGTQNFFPHGALQNLNCYKLTQASIETQFNGFLPVLHVLDQFQLDPSLVMFNTGKDITKIDVIRVGMGRQDDGKITLNHAHPIIRCGLPMKGSSTKFDHTIH